MVVQLDKKQLEEINLLAHSKLIKINLEKGKIMFTFANGLKLESKPLSKEKLIWVSRQKGYEEDFKTFINEIIKEFYG